MAGDIIKALLNSDDKDVRVKGANMLLEEITCCISHIAALGELRVIANRELLLKVVVEDMYPKIAVGSSEERRGSARINAVIDVVGSMEAIDREYEEGTLP